MFAGILLVNLFLNSMIINGEEACVISAQPVKEGSIVVDSFTNQPVLGSCKEYASVVMEMAKRDYPGAAITMTINGVNLNGI